MTKKKLTGTLNINPNKQNKHTFNFSLIITNYSDKHTFFARKKYFEYISTSRLKDYFQQVWHATRQRRFHLSVKTGKILLFIMVFCGFTWMTMSWMRGSCSSGFLTRSDRHRLVQSQKMSRSLNFRIEGEENCTICEAKTNPDQLCSYCKLICIFVCA